METLDDFVENFGKFEKLAEATKALDENKGFPQAFKDHYKSFKKLVPSEDLTIPDDASIEQKIAFAEAYRNGVRNFAYSEAISNVQKIVDESAKKNKQGTYQMVASIGKPEGESELEKRIRNYRKAIAPLPKKENEKPDLDEINKKLEAEIDKKYEKVKDKKFAKIAADALKAVYNAFDEFAIREYYKTIVTPAIKSLMEIKEVGIAKYAEKAMEDEKADENFSLLFNFYKIANKK